MSREAFLLLLVTVLIFCCSIKNAQGQDRNPWGIKAGINLSTVVGDDTDEVEPITGFHLGLFYTMPIAENFSLQPELLINRKGAKGEGALTYTDYRHVEGTMVRGNSVAEWETTTVLDYVQLPLLVVFSLDGHEGFQVIAGPSIGYLIFVDEKFITRVTFTPDNGSESIKTSDYFSSDNKAGYNRWDMGMNVGAGYLHSSGFGLCVRYERGFSTMVDIENHSITRNNANLMASLSYSF